MSVEATLVHVGRLKIHAGPAGAPSDAHRGLGGCKIVPGALDAWIGGQRLGEQSRPIDGRSCLEGDLPQGMLTKGAVGQAHESTQVSLGQATHGHCPDPVCTCVGQGRLGPKDVQARSPPDGQKNLDPVELRLQGGDALVMGVQLFPSQEDSEIACGNLTDELLPRRSKIGLGAPRL